MKKLLLFLALVALPAWGQTTTITGKVQDLGAAVATNSYVQFELRNYASNIPRVNGVSVLGARKKRFNPDTNGDVSGTLYRNDAIDPAGTYYRMCVFDRGRRFRCADFEIKAASFDISSATPMTTTPVVAPPTGDSTYQRLDGGNNAAGDYVPDATGRTLGSDAARWNAKLETVVAGVFNNIRVVDGNKFTTIQAAISDLP